MTPTAKDDLPSHQTLTRLLTGATQHLALTHQSKRGRHELSCAPQVAEALHIPTQLQFRRRQLLEDERAQLCLHQLAEALGERLSDVYRGVLAFDSRHFPASWRPHFPPASGMRRVWCCWWRVSLRAIRYVQRSAMLAVALDDGTLLPHLTESDTDQLCAGIVEKAVAAQVTSEQLAERFERMRDQLVREIAPDIEAAQLAMQQHWHSERQRIEEYYYYTVRQRQDQRRGSAEQHRSELELLVRERDILLEGLRKRCAPASLTVELTPRYHLLVGVACQRRAT